MKKSRSLIIILLTSCIALSAQARQIGSDHNRFLDCLRRLDPQNRMQMPEILESLVTRCRFDPGMPTDQFVKEYSALAPTALADGRSNGSLMGMLGPYHSKFSRQQMGFLQRVEQVFSGPSGRQALHQLSELQRQAEQSLGQSPMDQAVLAGLDIAVSSTQYWERNMPPRDGINMQAKWWQIVAADVAGGIVGGIFGGGVGAVGLGVGCSKLVAAL